MARKRYTRPSQPFYRINHFIRAAEVRAIDERGKQIGILPLSEALSLAGRKGLDLVEIAPKARPPVCKVIDFKKFKFLEDKKKQKEKQKAKKTELKEVRLTPFIAENDMRFRLERAEEFLKDGDKVKVFVFFRGREMTKKDFGYRLLEKALAQLSPISQIEVEPRFVGNRLETIIAPVKTAPAEPKKNKNNEKAKD